MKHVSTLTVGALRFYGELNTFLSCNFKSRLYEKLQKNYDNGKGSIGNLLLGI